MFAAPSLTMTDAETNALTRALARCDEAAWTDFHVRYYGFLLARMQARGVPEGDGPEAVQRVYLRVLRKVKTFQRTADFEAWLSCLARCEAIDSARSSRRRSWLSEKFANLRTGGEAVDPPVHQPAFGHLHEALKTLEGGDRALVTRHYVGGWSQEELAREQGVSVKAIESRLARLRGRLKAFLESPEGAPGTTL